MVIAKALCVALLLYWANFGDSKSLKNDTISERRTTNLALVPHPQEAQARRKTSDLTQYFPKMASERPPLPPLPTAPAPAIPPTPIFHISAEDHRLFLLLVLQTWSQKMKVGGFYDQISQLPYTQEKGGLYFIFGFPEKPDDDPNMIYPLYIGITGQDFGTRFSKHKTVKLGECETFKTSPQKGEVNLKQKAFVVNMPLPVAKFFESVFLSTFDFPMNEQENNKKRDTIWTGKPREVNDGRRLFIETLQDNFLKLENAAKLVLQDTTQILNPEFTTAIFKKWNKGGLSNLFAGLKI